MRSGGQASIEYLGVVALLAALVLTVGVVGGGDALAGSVVRQFQRALCVVRGGDCEEDRAPCTVSATTDARDEHVTVGLLRIGRRKLALVEHRSDGTVAVTVVREGDVGAEIGIGAGAWLTGDGGKHGFGAILRAAALAEIGDASTYLFDDAAAADNGLAVLAGGGRPARGRRLERVRRDGVGVVIAGLAKQGFGSVRADLIAATATEDATGRTRIILRAGAEDEALVVVAGRTGSGHAAGEERVALTLDRGGRPIDLAVTRTGELGGGADLPLSPSRQPLAGLPTVAVDGHRRWVVEQHLDLTEPGNRAAARAYVAAVRAERDLPVPPPRVTAELRRRLAEDGITDVRTYSLESDSNGIGAYAARGPGVGFSYGDSVEHARLVSARQRGADGVWQERSDCVGAAA